MNGYRDNFPVLQNYTYLNTASSGILSLQILKHRQEHDLMLLNQASRFREHYLKYVYDVKKIIANAFGGDASMIGLVPNYTWAMNAIAEALPKSLRIFAIKGEYPSVYEPFLTRNFKVQIENNHQSNFERIRAAIHDSKPDVFIVSQVQWDTGLKISAAQFRALRGDHPDMLILVDGTQSLGTHRFDFESSGMDAMMSSGYKWLGAGYGNGLVMMSERLVNRISLKVFGNNTIMNRLLTNKVNPGQLWEPGHIDTLNFTTLSYGIRALEDVGWELIDKQINKLALTLKTGLVQAGYLTADHLAGNHHSGICLMPGPAKLVRELAKQDILVSYRNGIRISYHYYNTTKDIQRFLDALRVLI